MGKRKTVSTVAEAARELDGIRKAVSMAGRAMARLETEAERIDQHRQCWAQLAHGLDRGSALRVDPLWRHHNSNRGR